MVGQEILAPGEKLRNKVTQCVTCFKATLRLDQFTNDGPILFLHPHAPILAL
jgi:hypothetical protein